MFLSSTQQKLANISFHTIFWEYFWVWIIIFVQEVFLSSELSLSLSFNFNFIVSQYIYVFSCLLLDVVWPFWFHLCPVTSFFIHSSISSDLSDPFCSWALFTAPISGFHFYITLLPMQDQILVVSTFESH